MIKNEIVPLKLSSNFLELRSQNPKAMTKTISTTLDNDVRNAANSFTLLPN
ncbi:hypothetical protein LSAJ156_160004 [Latilactobacillus sakei]|nr:hypothetical protein LSAJ156_160004 [Latilactobacillus sakei]SON64680.1 protein of unknown function [Latilactobacillus sakei]SON67993.1 protein of unknown function [Latilactobacillus sakei]SON72690.1 protein of unknown function [Latilactobacillus sakei]